MTYSLVNHARIFFNDNDAFPGVHIVNPDCLNKWLTYRIAFWFTGGNPTRILVIYPMETEKIKLTHKVIDGKFHVYYNPNHSDDMVIRQIGDVITVGTKLKLTDSGLFQDSERAHVFL